MPQKANIDLNELMPEQGFPVVDSSIPDDQTITASSLGAITGNGMGAISYVMFNSSNDDIPSTATIRTAFGTPNVTSPFDMASLMNGKDGIEITIQCFLNGAGTSPLGNVFGGDYAAFGIVPVSSFLTVIPGNDNWQSPISIGCEYNAPIPGASVIETGAIDYPISGPNFDVNGDGLADIVTNPTNETSTVSLSTQTCTYFGNINGFPPNMNQSYIDGNIGACVTVIFQGTHTSAPAFPISSINGDIFDDLLACNPLASPYPGILASGQCIVIYGQSKFPAYQTITVGEPFNGIVINGPKYDFAGMGNNNFARPTNGNKIILDCLVPECSNQLAVINANQNLPPVMSYDDADFFITGISGYWAPGDFNRDGKIDLGAMINGSIPVIIMDKSYPPEGNVSYEDTDYVTISGMNDRMGCAPLRDFDGDGYSELFCGYVLTPPNGTIIGYVLYSDDSY